MATNDEFVDRVERALAIAYRYLARRERTVSEMRRRLERAALDPDVCDRAIVTLLEHGSLDDARFVRLFVEEKRELEGWGRIRIRETLISRGIERETADAELETVRAEDELERALGLLRRRFLAPPRGRRERDRALGMLLRRGFELDLALEALSGYARTKPTSAG